MKARITTAWNLTTLTPKHISEVANGAKCGCTCFECKKPLVAANGGKIQEHHFKHKAASNCEGSPETGLHKLAKRIVAESESIRIFSGFYFDYLKSIEEKQFENITPDVQIINDLNEFWFIEIAVTHFIDPDKLKKLQYLNVNCLEIDLSKINRFIEFSELKELLLNNKSLRKVISRETLKTDEIPIPEKKKNKVINPMPWVVGGSIALIVGGLIYRFRKRKSKESIEKKPVSKRRKTKSSPKNPSPRARKPPTP